MLGWLSGAYFSSSPERSTVECLPAPVRGSRAPGNDSITPRGQPPTGAPKLKGLGQRVKEGLPGSAEVPREDGSPRGVCLQEIQKPSPGPRRHSWPDPNQQSVGWVLLDVGLIRRELAKLFGREQLEEYRFILSLRKLGPLKIPVPGIGRGQDNPVVMAPIGKAGSNERPTDAPPSPAAGHLDHTQLPDLGGAGITPSLSRVGPEVMSRGVQKEVRRQPPRRVPGLALR
jgi:hypothetical protein